MSRFTSSRRGSDPGGAASAAVIFAILAAVLAVVAGAALLLLPNTKQVAQPQAALPAERMQSASGVTSEEAIGYFGALERRSYEGLEARDADVLDSIYTKDSPVRARALKDVATLERTNTQVEIRSQTKDLDVRSVSQGQIRLRQIVVVETRFTNTKTGGSAGGAREQQIIDWVLRRENGRWLIYDAVVISAERLE